MLNYRVSFPFYNQAINCFMKRIFLLSFALLFVSEIIAQNTSANSACTAVTGGTISPVTISKCNGQNYTVIVNGASTEAASGTGITYQWEVSTSGGGVGFSNVNGANSTTLLLDPLQTGSYYYRLKVTCSNGPVSAYSNEFHLMVNPSPVVNVTPSSAGLCFPASSGVTLNSSGAITYSWTPSAGLSSNVGNSVSAKPNVSTNYLVTGTDVNGCQDTAIAVIKTGIQFTVNAAATPAAVCSGANSQLNAHIPLLDNQWPIKISEVSTNGNGYGKTVNPPSYISLNSGTMVEISNIGTYAVDVSGWTVSTYAQNAANATTVFTFPAGTIIPPHAVAIVNFGQGTDNIPVRYFNTQIYNPGSSQSIFGIVIKNGSLVVDAIGISGGVIFNPSSGVTVADWSGYAPNSTSYAGPIRTTSIDNNTGADWTLASPALAQTMGTYTDIMFDPIPVVQYSWSPSTFITGQEHLKNPLATNVVATTNYSLSVTSNAGCTASSSATVTMAPLNCASITYDSIRCSNAPFKIYANRTAGGAPFHFQWSDGAGGVYPDKDTLTVSLPSGNYNYTVTVTDNCGSSCTTSKSIAVSAYPSAVAGSSLPVCAGKNLSLSASTNFGNGFIWTGPNGFTSTQQNPVIANVSTAANGNYKLRSSFNGCLSPVSIINVWVNPGIGALTVSPSSISRHADSPAIRVTASNALVNDLLVSENFNGGSTSWTRINKTLNADSLASAWSVKADGFRNLHSKDSTTFIYTFRDCSRCPITETILQSPQFNTTGYSNASISFDHNFYTDYGITPSNQPARIYVEISKDSITWTTLKTFSEGYGYPNINFISENLPLTSGFLNEAHIFIRFRFVADMFNYSAYWAVDNISVTGVKNIIPVWSSLTGLYLDSAASLPYTGSPSNTVYVKPQVSTIYTATASANTGCKSEATVVVTLVPSGGITWTGSIDSKWEIPGNWSGAYLPHSLSNIVIPAGSIVVINSAAVVNSIKVDPGAQIIVSSGASLSVIH